MRSLFGSIPTLFFAGFMACWTPTYAVESASSPEVRQLIISLAPDWISSTGKMLALERDANGEWKQALGPIPVLFGKNGLAWGRGILGADEPGRHKVERDACAPAGVFRLGKIYTYDSSLPKGADYPFHTVTSNDAWVDDPSLPEYNRFVTVDPKNPPAWFEKQKMRRPKAREHELVGVAQRVSIGNLKCSVPAMHLQRLPHYSE